MHRRHFYFHALAAVLAMAACTTITEELPDTGNPVNPAPVIVVPVPVPTPAPTPAPPPPPSQPTPAPAPQPTPAPAPPPAGAQGCGLPPGTGTGNNCPRTSQSFLRDVDAAINLTIQQHPELFNLNQQQGQGGYLVKNRNRYYAEVAKNLNARGLCAIDDGVELAVKNTNRFSDQYRIDISSGYIRRGDSSYRATCFPAWF